MKMPITTWKKSPSLETSAEAKPAYFAVFSCDSRSGIFASELRISDLAF
jgi:hypothetical protein